MKIPIPVIDLFAGPGGLGEGFSSLRDANGRPVFQVRLSVEKDHFAHRTLELRSFFRKFPDGKVPEELLIVNWAEADIRVVNVCRINPKRTIM